MRLWESFNRIFTSSFLYARHGQAALRFYPKHTRHLLYFTSRLYLLYDRSQNHKQTSLFSFDLWNNRSDLNDISEWPSHIRYNWCHSFFLELCFLCFQSFSYALQSSVSLATWSLSLDKFCYHDRNSLYLPHNHNSNRSDFILQISRIYPCKEVTARAVVTTTGLPGITPIPLTETLFVISLLFSHSILNDLVSFS
jgi:hypothetical protein